MRLGGVYSFNGGRDVIEQQYSSQLNEVLEVISTVDAKNLQKKISKEKTMVGRELFSPRLMNKAFTVKFTAYGWQHHRVICGYPEDYYTPGYRPATKIRPAFRDMDFVKDRVGVEIQLGKYAFMVYNVCAKMTIFHNQDVIDVGIEVVPLKELAVQMSSGVSYFEQIVWDLEQRGVADIDIPVLVLGIAP
jgi:hypothetical protein